MGSIDRVSIEEKPCSSNVSRMTSRKRCSTMRSDGRYSGKPLIGGTLAALGWRGAHAGKSFR